MRQHALALDSTATTPPAVLPATTAAARLDGQLFDTAVTRITGMPTRVIEVLHAREAAARAEEILALDTVVDRAREALAERLHDPIGACHDRKLRGTLLAIRRDVHNGRRPKDAALDRSRSLLPDDLHQALVDHARALDRRTALEDALEARFAEELKDSQEHLLDACRDADFRAGLLLSSQSVSKQLGRLLAKPRGMRASKRRQLERGLLRFLSRMAMKTSPFGTFCTVAPSRWAASAEHLHFTADPRPKTSCVRVNKALYEILIGDLLQVPAIRHHLDVELNPTLGRDGDRWLLLAAKAGRESFQRLSPNPILGLLTDRLGNDGHQPLGRLIEQLCTAPEVEAEPEVATAFLDRLIDVGFLRFRVGIPEQETDWDRRLAEILEPIDDPNAQRARQLLRDLRTRCDAYQRAPVDQRQRLLAEASELAHQAFADAKNRIGPELPFYEDASSDTTLALPRDQIEAAGRTLATFIGKTLPCAWPRPAQATMRAFYDGFYGKAPAIPLLRYYEDYYREHFKDYLERQGRADAGLPKKEGDDYDLSNPFGVPMVDAINKASEALTELIRVRWHADPDAEEIRLDREDLDRVLADVPTPGSGARSAALFGQLIPAERPEDARLVITDYVSGFGKYGSRFLDLLPPEVTRAVQRRNAAVSGARLAEICGDSGFNGNFHPPLVPWEISYPTGESGDSGKVLRSAELVVTPAPDDPNSLWLRHGPSGERVLPVDLGFLNTTMRPPLFQLLSRFQTITAFNLAIPSSPLPPEEAKAEQGGPSLPLRARPRVTFEGTVVLARRTWLVPDHTFPTLAKGESEAAYFLRVRRWRARHDIPRDVFLRVFGRTTLPAAGAKNAQEQDAPQPAADAGKPAADAVQPAADAGKTAADAGKPAADAGKAPNEAEARQEPPPKRPQRALRGHSYKPQYVDLESPLLLSLFARAAEGYDQFGVTLEERLPARDHLARFEDDRYVTEMVLEVDFPAPGDSTSRDAARVVAAPHVPEETRT